MRFIVDAQLPLRLALWFKHQGFDCLHTLDLPEANRTGDDYIRDICTADGRIVITKDTDFLKSHLINHTPPKIILVTTGNIPNNPLLNIFAENKDVIITLLESYNVIEINATAVIVYKG